MSSLKNDKQIKYYQYRKQTIQKLNDLKYDKDNLYINDY